MRARKYLKLKKSKAGLGLFTEQPIRKGDFVIEYTGERIGKEEADRRGGKYLFDVTKKLVVDGTGRENLSRYVNHSCRPNCCAEIDEDKEKIFIYAKRAIKAGEELSYHYGKGYWEDHIGPKKCMCLKCADRRTRAQHWYTFATVY